MHWVIGPGLRTLEDVAGGFSSARCAHVGGWLFLLDFEAVTADFVRESACIRRARSLLKSAGAHPIASSTQMTRPARAGGLPRRAVAHTDSTSTPRAPKSRGLLVALILATVALTGCGDGSDSLGAKAAPVTCTDADADGYGVGCALGGDCDDSDPDVGACDVAVDDGDDDKSKGNDKEGEACTQHEGETRDCKIDLGTTNGVHTCWDGTQTCEEGVWGPCVVGV